MKVLTEIKHTPDFGATPFCNIQKIDKFGIASRFKSFGNIVHNTNRSPLYLILESIIPIVH